MKQALISSARHAATAAAGALGALQFDASSAFAKKVVISLIGAGFAGIIRFLTLAGEK